MKSTKACIEYLRSNYVLRRSLVKLDITAFNELIRLLDSTEGDIHADMSRINRFGLDVVEKSKNWSRIASLAASATTFRFDSLN